MKRTTKIIASLLALLTVFGACAMTLTSCGPEPINQDDGTKTKLYVNNYAGGFGKDWLNNVEKRFEEAYANVSFEDGKTGVDVVINHNKDQGENYLSKIDAMEDEVFFPGNIYYYEWVNAGKMLDITDVVSELIDGESKSILDKMTADEKEFYGVDGKYYAIPHHESQPGIVYDKDLFDAKRLYFAKNGAPSEDYASDKASAGGFNGTVAYTNGAGEKSAGPDGKHGTYDDGLPATYEEFFTLCDRMKLPSINVTPFTWTGKTKDYYTDLLLGALATDYEGAEQLKLQYSYNGLATNLISVDASGKVTELPDEQITLDNGYKVYQSAGRYYALKFLETIVDKNYYSDACFGSRTHLEVQADFIKTTKTKENAVAFLVDGNWWENEATGSFDELVKYFPDGGYAKTERNFAFLPLPKATNDKIGEGVTVPTTEVSLGFIKNSIKAEKVKVAKEFLKFCYTDASLNEYTKTTGLPAALQYELDAEIYNGLSTYGKSICDLKDTAVKPYANNDIYKSNYASSIINFTFTFSGSKHACGEMKDHGKSAEELFRMIVNGKTESSWKK